MPCVGPVEFLPWLDSQEWGEDWRVIDERGDLVPFQVLAPGSIVDNLLLLLPMKPQQMRVLRIQYDGGALALPPVLKADSQHLGGLEGVSVTKAVLQLGDGLELPVPFVELYEYVSDTWLHNLNRYTSQALAHTSWRSRRS